MSKNTGREPECKACGCDWLPADESLIAVALRCRIKDPLDKLILVQLAYRAAADYAVFCIDAPDKPIDATPTKIRNSLDRLQHSGLISYGVTPCRCGGEMRNVSVYLHRYRMEAR